MKFILHSFNVILFSAISTIALAGTTVQLSEVHLCCATCQKTVENAVNGIPGASANVDRDAKTVSVSASNDTITQQALDAIGQAGFYGKSNHDHIAIKTPMTEGQTSSAELSGFHNCCGSCANAVQSAVNSIDFVKTAVVNKRTCQVKGDFNVAEVLKAVNNAGFSAMAANH